jgi:hypothetical protein
VFPRPGTVRLVSSFFVGYGETVQYVHRSLILLSDLKDIVCKCVEDIPTRGLGFRSRAGCMEDNTGNAGTVHFAWIQRFSGSRKLCGRRLRGAEISRSAKLHGHYITLDARDALSRESLCLASRINLHVMLPGGSINTHTCPTLRVDGQNGLETWRPFPQALVGPLLTWRCFRTNTARVCRHKLPLLSKPSLRPNARWWRSCAMFRAGPQKSTHRRRCAQVTLFHLIASKSGA